MGAFIAQKSYIRMNSVCVPEATTEITFSSILFTGISRKCEKKRFVYFYCYGLCLCYAIILAIIVLAAVIGARKSQERKDLKLKKIFQFPVSIFPFSFSTVRPSGKEFSVGKQFRRKYVKLLWHLPTTTSIIHFKAASFRSTSIFKVPSQDIL